MTDAVREIVDTILEGLPVNRRALIAIDGVDGSGKSTFAAAIARQVTGRPVVLIHVDNFLNPSAIRHRLGRISPQGFFADTYDYAALGRLVLQPLGPTGTGIISLKSFDSARDAVAPSQSEKVPADALVIFEGMFLHRDGLPDIWDRSVFLDVPFAETARRMAARDGSNPDPEYASMRRYVEGQRIYFRSARPWTRANLVIDNSTPANPRVIDPLSATASYGIHGPLVLPLAPPTSQLGQVSRNLGVS